MKRDYRVYIDDIVEAVKKIEKYSKAKTWNTFQKDEMAIDAIVRNFEVIGEATKRVPESIRRKYPDIPWKTMSGMRDKLIHEYFGVNTQTLWKTVKEDLPGVRSRIEALSRDLEREARG